MAIESKNLLVWVKAMSRGQALPLDASEVWESLEDAKTYAAGVADASSVAYVGQTLKVKNANSVDTYVISDAAGNLSKLAAATTVDDVYTKHEVDSAIAEYKHAITASASDDDIIVLEGTGGQNAVSYKATHADSGVTPGTYNSITVDAKGHITSGEQIDVYTKSESDALVYTISANAEDDDVVVLTGTSGENAVTYKATHAKTNNAGTYTKVTVNDYGHITGGDKPKNIADLGIEDVYTKSEIDSALSGYKHTITANAEDDDVVVLEGTAGANAVSYKATHADSGVNAGEYTKVSVNTKGHITKGSKPTAIADLGITDVYTKNEVDAKVSEYKHTIAAGADDDDVIILESTSGENAVSYKATHAKTNKAGEYTKVTINEYGHVTDGSSPKSIADLGIDDVYTKNEIDSCTSDLKKYTDDSIKIKEDITVQLGDGGTVGGYTTGNTINKDTSIMDILKKLLQKAVPAVYKAPELKLSAVGDKAGNYEYGTNITAQVSASFTPNDAGAIQSIAILKDGTQIKTGTGSQLTSDSEAIQLTNTVSYTATADYAEGDIKNNNLGEASPDGHIQAGTITSSTVTFTPYRCGYFYGVLNTDSSTPLTSDIIRSGTKRNGAYKAETIAQEIKASSVANRKRIFVACPAANKGVTKVIMPSAQNADCTKNFVKQASTITVEGANGYTGIAYNVWVYEPALISDDQTFKVTLG